MKISIILALFVTVIIFQFDCTFGCYNQLIRAHHKLHALATGSNYTSLNQDELASPVKRLHVWYVEKNDAWTQWNKMFGFYRVEKSLVNGKPSYTSEHEEGAYAVWYDENRNWCLGPSSMRGKKEFYCNFYADGKVHSGSDDFCPTDTDYVWQYTDRNGYWKPTNHGFKIISAQGKKIL